MKSIITLVGIAAAFAVTSTAAGADPAAERSPEEKPEPAAPETKRIPIGPTSATAVRENTELEPGPDTAAPPAAGFPGSGMGLLLEPRVGGFLPTGRLGPSASFGLQAGRILVEEKQLWAIVEFAFARPSLSGSGDGAGAPLGSFNYDLAVNDVAILLGSRMMFPTRIDRLTPFAEAGLKLHVLHSTSNGRTESFGSFGATKETSLAPGLALRGGATYRLGPGAVSAGLELGYARVGQLITGEVWFGGLGFFGGYLYAF